MDYLLATAINTTNRLLAAAAPIDVVAPLLPFDFSSSNFNFAPQYLLLSILAVCLTSCLRGIFWCITTKARLDYAEAQSPDDILADRELRALRRALLMLDVTRYVPKLIKYVDHIRARKRIKLASKKDRGHGMVSLHSETNAILPVLQPAKVVEGNTILPSFIGAEVVSEAARAAQVTSSLRYASEAYRAQSATQNELASASLDKNKVDQSYTEVLNVLRMHTLFKYVDPTLLLILAKSTTEITLKKKTFSFNAAHLSKHRRCTLSKVVQFVRTCKILPLPPHNRRSHRSHRARTTCARCKRVERCLPCWIY